MADNLAVTPGSGAVVGADDIGGVLYQRVKLGLGADGTAVDAVAGAGAVGTGVQRVTLASDDPLVAAVKAEDAASTDGDKGFPALAVRKATPANTSGADGDYEFLQVSAGRLWASATIDAALPAGTNLIGKVGIDQTTPGTTNGVVPVAAATGGADPQSFISDGTAKNASWKAAAGTLSSLSLGNTSASPRYVRVYDKATAAGAGDTPKLRYMIPGSTTGAGREVQLPPTGVAFALGIQLRITTGAADNDDSAAASNEVIVSGATK